MLTIGLGPAFASGGGGGGGATPGIFSLDFVETIATAKVTDKTITEFPRVDTSMLTSMDEMFLGCKNLVEIPLLNTSKVTTMKSIFRGCSSLQSVPLFDTSNVKDMSAMFSGCSSLKSVPQLNTSNVTNMSNMFYNCTLLQTIPQLDVSKVTSMSSIFSNCFSIVSCLLKGLATSLELHHASELEKSSVLFMFENAQTVTTSKTIKLHADVFAQLTEDEIAIATEKGFSVVSA